MSEPEDRHTSRELKSLAPAVAFIKPYKWQVAGASVALVITASVTLSVGQGMRLLIDRGFSAEGPDVLMSSIGVFAALILLLAAGTYARFYFVSWVGERVSADIRQAVYARLVYLHPAFFERNQPTEIQSRITTDTTLLQTVIGSSVSIALRNILMFLGGVTLLFVTNPKLSMIVFISVPIVVMPIVFFGRRVRSLSRTSQDRLADVGTYVGESLRSIKVLQAFNHQDQDVRSFLHRVDEAFTVAVARIRQRAWMTALVMVLVLAAIAGMLWIGGQDVLAGRTSGGELAAFIFYAFIVAGSVGAISEVWSDLQRAAGATERLFELLQARSELPEPATPKQPSRPGAVTFEKVGFVYPMRPEVAVLTDVDLSIEPGEMVAFVGPSGAGKSTLFELVQRFYDPTSGRVLIGDTAAGEMSLATLRGELALVPQDPQLFSGTLRDNVCYGAPGASPQQIEKALAASHALSFVDQLPEGLDTVVGEEGVGLSGGQRQRLAIARAMLVEPHVLLMDEATSSLDAESEDAIRNSIRELKGRCTVMIIAHRLSTVTHADRIVVLDGGQIIDQGAHADLLDSSDLYRRFARIQLSATVAEEVPKAVLMD